MARTWLVGSLPESYSATSTLRYAGASVHRNRPLGVPEATIKRGLDIVLCLLLLLLTMPFVLLGMLATWLETPGSPIYHQIRIGRDGRPFRLFKIRTMVRGNSPQAHQEYVIALIQAKAAARAGMYKMVDDPRITRVGRILRRFSIDELPQLVNVLKGDMSIVGPRPPLPYEAELYTERDRLRLRVRPGLTGLWQVSGRATTSFQQMVDLDIAYWQSWSLRLELSILLRTPRAVVAGVGAA